MTNYKRYVLLFALAVLIAGVFATLIPVSVYAEQSYAPWNPDVEIRHGNDVYRYCLADNMADSLDEADKRGLYSGCDGKRALADSLLALGLPSEAVYDYVLPGFRQIARRFSYVNAARIDAQAHFSADGFTYSKPQDGVSIDVDTLFDAVIRSRGKRVVIDLPLIVDKAVTVSEVKANTVVRGSFSTTYYSSSANRCYNIGRATSVLNGITVRSGESFSFNDAVGERTEKNGYKNAKIILDGNYADGVGGGVCQVSTTLYNALLLAGFVPKARRHSLVSSYVMAGFDAMVSYGSADLTFTNDTPHDVYIQGKVNGKSVTFTIYGEPNGYQIKRENVEERTPFEVKEIVDKVKYPELVYADQTKVITNGSDGVKTKSYLKYYKDGKLVATKLIRTDSYKKVDKVIARGYLPCDQQPIPRPPAP